MPLIRTRRVVVSEMERKKKNSSRAYDSAGRIHYTAAAARVYTLGTIVQTG